MNNLTYFIYITSGLFGVYIMSVLISKYFMKFLLKNRRIFKLPRRTFFFVKYFLLFLMFLRVSLLTTGFITPIILILIFIFTGPLLLANNLVLLDGSEFVPYEYIKAILFDTPMEGPVAPAPAPIPPAPPLPPMPPVPPAPANPPLPIQVPQGGNPFFNIPPTIWGPVWLMNLGQNAYPLAMPLLFAVLIAFIVIDECLAYRDKNGEKIPEAEIIEFLNTYKNWNESEEDLRAALFKLHKDYIKHIALISKTPGGGSDADRRKTELFKLAVRKGYQVGAAKYKWFNDNFTYISALFLGIYFFYIYILPEYSGLLIYLIT